MDPQYFPLVVGAMSFLGALFGGVAGIVIKARIDAKVEKSRWAREDRFRHKDELITAYKQFLTAMETWTNHNTQGYIHSMDPEVMSDPYGSPQLIDAAQKTIQEMRESHEVVKMLAPPVVVKAANDYVGQTFLLPPPNYKLPIDSQRMALRKYNDKVKGLRDALMETIRRELGTNIDAS